jgi:DNA-binding beta-propeller fold protein YncE
LYEAVVDPTGAYLYIVDGGSTGAGSLYSYNFTTSTGVIGAEIGTAPVATGVGPGLLAIDPTGALLAIDNNIDNTISLFTSSAGVLTAVTPAIPVGTAPFGITFSVANQ